MRLTVNGGHLDFQIMYRGGGGGGGFNKKTKRHILRKHTKDFWYFADESRNI